MSDLLLSTMPAPDVTLLPLVSPPRNIVALTDRTFADTPAIRATIQALRAAANMCTAGPTDVPAPEPADDQDGARSS